VLNFLLKSTYQRISNEMKKWFAIVCPVCGWRHPTKKFGANIKPIDYPLQIVTGGGRAKGFRTEKYLPWSSLPHFANTKTWNSLLNLYSRLAAAYDHFYQELGFLSPGMQKLIKQLQRSYTTAYLTDPLPQYTEAYISKQPNDIVEAYSKTSYPRAYTHLLINQP
jgi:hypothetical protein